MTMFTSASGIVPSVFTAYAIERTKELTAFVSSGIVQDSPVLTNWLTSEIGSGGGNMTLNRPTWNDLANTAARVGDESVSPLYTSGFATAFPTPEGITTHNVIAVRVDRNMHWSSSALAAAVLGTKNLDPIGVIASLVGGYWARQYQLYVLSILTGVLADNDLAPGGSDTHTQFDLTFDVSGAVYAPGVTDFSAPALYDALQTMGDADNQITNLAVHSAVRNRMRKNNLIDVVRDSDGNYLFDSFQGLRLTVDDGMPKTGNVYDSYLFGPGFLEYGTAAPKNATTTVWRDEAGLGAGAEELWNRVCWSVHPMGHAYIGSTAVGGPSNSTLQAAASWSRRAQSRKHIPFARLRTREA